MIAKKVHNFVKTVMQSRLNWFAFVPIILFQLTLISHQFEEHEHEVDHNEGSCHVCIQLERVDDNSFSQPAHFSLPKLYGLINIEKSSPLEQSVLYYNFKSRAPPHI